jgi:MoxR-like ATPase
MNATTDALGLALSANEPILLWGSPGSGKSTVVNQIAASLGWPIEVVIASIREPSDFAGLPFVVNGSVSLSPPRWAEALRDVEHGVVFFDELTTAAPSVQAALLRVPIERVVGDTKLGAGIRVVAAANRSADAAGAWELSAPTANRFCHLDWQPSPFDIADGFIGSFPEVLAPHLPADWAHLVPIVRSEIGGFLRSRPTLVTCLPDDIVRAGRAWPSPRTWAMAARLLAAARSASVSDACSDLLVAGCVGAGAAHEFLTWRRDFDLVDPEFLLADPTSIKMPRRSDHAFAVLAAVVAAVISNNTPERWERAWAVVHEFVAADKHDVAAIAARQLARNRPAGANPPRRVADLFPLLQEAGLV